jgi:hypothetical protein
MRTGMDERLLNPVSNAELDRRWAAVRKAVAEHGVAALVVQSNNDWLGGSSNGSPIIPPPTAIPGR